MCPVHLTILYLIIVIIHGQEYKLWSSLCSSLQPPITLSLFGRNILNTLFPKSLSLCSSLNIRPSFTPIQDHKENYILCILIFMFLDIVPVFFFYYLKPCSYSKWPNHICNICDQFVIVAQKSNKVLVTGVLLSEYAEKCCTCFTTSYGIICKLYCLAIS
jgi:hypothetical protein